ncbi:hypothetical protein KY335_05165 [Candidatus Woesearchaeota archaeon]|nr:hypothetical protein [Candidatus Woesearchaeota archaeon]
MEEDGSGRVDLSEYVIYVQRQAFPGANMLGDKHPCLPPTQDEARLVIAGFIEGCKLLSGIFGEEIPPCYYVGENGSRRIDQLAMNFPLEFEARKFEPLEDFDPVIYAIMYDNEKCKPEHITEFERFLEIYFCMQKVLPIKREKKKKSILV